MAAGVIRTRLDADALGRPEFQPFLGKEVEIRLAVPTAADEVEYDEDGPVPTLEQVRAMMAKIPGKLSDFVVEMREEERR